MKTLISLVAIVFCVFSLTANANVNSLQFPDPTCRGEANAMQSYIGDKEAGMNFVEVFTFIMQHYTIPKPTTGYVHHVEDYAVATIAKLYGVNMKPGIDAPQGSALATMATDEYARLYRIKGWLSPSAFELEKWAYNRCINQPIQIETTAGQNDSGLPTLTKPLVFTPITQHDLINLTALAVRYGMQHPDSLYDDGGRDATEIILAYLKNGTYTMSVYWYSGADGSGDQQVQRGTFRVLRELLSAEFAQMSAVLIQDKAEQRPNFWHITAQEVENSFDAGIAAHGAAIIAGINKRNAIFNDNLPYQYGYLQNGKVIKLAASSQQ